MMTKQKSDEGPRGRGKKKGKRGPKSDPEVEQKHPANVDSRLLEELDKAEAEDTIEAVVMIKRGRKIDAVTEAERGGEDSGSGGPPGEKRRGLRSVREEDLVEQEAHDRDFLARIVEETGEEPIEAHYLPRLGAVYLKARKRLVERVIEDDDVSSATSAQIDIDIA